MRCRSYATAGSFLVFMLATALLPFNVSSADSQYKVAMKRSNPNDPISRDGILSAVNDKYKGRILSVQEKPSPSSPDCHIIRMLSLTGEYMTIYVACD